MTRNDSKVLWDSILAQKNFKEFDINTFKEGGANTRITQYNYQTHGLLFLKNILYKMIQNFSEEQMNFLKKIDNRNVGGGVNITYDCVNVDLDYLLAVEEATFLSENMSEINSILEIGAGYGRTCHTLLSLFPHISEYRILDLPQMLKISKCYLEKVVSKENFSKITFISAGSEYDAKSVDLIINIDSMQEMPEETVISYLSLINKYAKFFYCNNTVGKFDPKLCGWEESEASILAMNSGILKDKVNIFCPAELNAARRKFVSLFSPGEKWSTKKQEKVDPWTHYYQVLYGKNV